MKHMKRLEVDQTFQLLSTERQRASWIFKLSLKRTFDFYRQNGLNLVVNGQLIEFNVAFEYEISQITD